MTGEPEFTFRDEEENPECSCGSDMELKNTRETRLEEVDVYICPECQNFIEDKWSY